MGPINITYVNRGRALQHAGKCEEADESYEAAFSAPAMSEPSAENVAATIERYRGELRETCPGRIVLECDPLELRVSVGGRNMGECPREAIELSGGEHLIRGTLMGKSVETVVAVTPLKTRRLSLRLNMDESAPALQRDSDFDEAGSSDGVQPVAVDALETPDRASKSRGYWLLGGGTGMVVVGMALTDEREEANNVIPLALYIGGVTMIVYGVLALMQ